MSVNLQQICQNVRIRLGNPEPQIPTLQQVFLAVVSCAQSIYNRAEQSGQNWATEEIVLQVTSNTQDFLITNVSAYSKPLQVLTYYPSNPSLPQRYVDFSLLSDLNYDWNLPVNIASFMFTDGSPNTAQRMAFYYKNNGELWVRVLPMPNLSGSYQVTFSVGEWADSAAITDSPILNQFHELIEVWAAFSILPSCEWSDDPKENRERRKEYGIALKDAQGRVQPEFENYIMSLVEEHLTSRSSSLEWNNDTSAGGFW